MTDRDVARDSKRLCCAAVAMLLVVFSASGDESAPDDVASPSVAKLVRGLGSPERQTRLEAEQALLRRGYAVLSELPPLEELPNASAREAVRRIRLHLERAEAEASLQPTKVRWDGGTTLAAAVARISEQTGNRVVLADAGSATTKSFTPTDDEQTFWEAIVALEREFRLQAVAGPERSLVLTAVGKSPPPLWSGSTGVLRVSLRGLSQKPIPGRDERLLRWEWDVQAEPRLRPLLMKLHVDEQRFTTPAGEALPSFNPGAVIEFMPGQAHGPQQIRLDSLVPPGPLPARLNCRLTLPMLVATGSQDFVFPRALDGSARTVRHGGAFVTLFPAHLAFDRWIVPLRVVYETGGPAFESHRNWFYQNEIRLGAGNVTYSPKRPPQLTLGANGAVGLEYEFADFDDARDAVLTYRVPTLLIDSQWTIEAEVVLPPELVKP